MRSLLKTTALTATLIFGTSMLPAQAAEPTDASVLKLMQVMHMSETMDQMLGSQHDIVQPMIQAELSHAEMQDLTPAQKQQVAEIINRNVRDMLDKVRPQMVQLSHQGFIDASKKYYTQEEVDAQIEFYSSPVGQSIIEKQPEVMQDYMMTAMPEIMKAVDEQMRITLPAMKKELDAVIPPHNNAK
ncbi:DUF2059 domain-containing protein [Psychrobacter sp. I-STPA6b]|uniref:DUF2059 domain-containing protein n=1 Tax=Psychrobacter sp. I-STPA6b TaxID=2585718 RepID=UPI001D0C8B29|nr:DUF2059 domain-containing protein [Psychrobacter sp. I-STPA6b]